VLVTRVSIAKTAQLIEMSFGVLTCVALAYLSWLCYIWVPNYTVILLLYFVMVCRFFVCHQSVSNLIGPNLVPWCSSSVIHHINEVTFMLSLVSTGMGDHLWAGIYLSM